MDVPHHLFQTATIFTTITQISVDAQIALTAAPQFEVASMKPSAPGARGPTIYNPTRERFVVNDITPKSLIPYAYDVRDFQVSGGPSWLGPAQYDIVAKPQGDVSSERILAIARNLLAERFNLKLYRESKELSVFALTVAKGGPRPQPSVGTGAEVSGGTGRLITRSVTMGMFAARLVGRVLGRPVLDRTGIAREFDITLEWAPDQSPFQLRHCAGQHAVVLPRGILGTST
jgi:uncharacterized protein (TIGR03435 family)